MTIDLEKPLEITGVLFVHGISHESRHQKFLKWLAKDPSNTLVFIEDDEKTFLHAFHAPFFKHPQVKCHLKGDSDSFLERLALEYVLLPVHFASSVQGELFFFELGKKMGSANLLAADSQDLGVKVLSNLYCNQRKLIGSYLAETLFHHFRGVPAIVIGAGASLDAQLPLLKHLDGKALLIAGGSAVSILSEHQINPHFCVHLDPSPPKERFLSQDVYEVPHFYRSRFSPELLETIHAPLLWVRGSGSYPIEGWLAEQYGLTQEFYEGGWTVANLALALAYDLGCEPIITVGMEFSYEKKIYGGTLEGKEHREEGMTFLENGKTLFSKGDWLKSREWMVDFVQKHPERRMMNATEGGLEIFGMEKKTLTESLSLCSRQFDLIGMIHQAIQESAFFPATPFQEKQTLERLSQSFAKTQNRLQELLMLWQKYYPASPLEKGEYILLFSELEEEVVYREILKPLWQVWKGPILRQNQDALGGYVHQLLFFIRVMKENGSWILPN